MGELSSSTMGVVSDECINYKYSDTMHFSPPMSVDSNGKA